MKKYYSKFALLSLTLPISLFLGSCDHADLDEAENFGLMSAKFKEDTKALSDDIFGSCMRRTHYYPLLNAEGKSPKADEIDNCQKKYQPASQQAKSASMVLVNYIESIGKLASKDVANFDASLTNIATALNGLSEVEGFPRLNPEEVSGGAKIAGFLANLWKQDFQRDQLQTIIPCTDPAIQTHSQLLKEIFGEGYIDYLLSLEQQQMLTYYKEIAARMLNNGADQNSLVPVNQEYTTELNAFLDRRDAAYTYLAVIDETAQTHARLAKIFTKDGEDINSVAFQQRCDRFFASSGKSESKLHQNQSEITIEQWQEAQKVVTQYYQEVTPLLENIEESFEN